MEFTLNNTLIFKSNEAERAEKMSSLCSESAQTEKQFLELLALHNRKEKNILEALNYAKNLNFSKNHLKSSYLSHPLRLASYLIKIIPDIHSDYIVIALLHNVPETTEITIEELKTTFNETISSGIDTLVIDRAAHFPSIQKNYYKAIFSKGTALIMVKLIDKIDNLFVLGLNPDDEVRKNYIQEIREELLPFASNYNPLLGKYLDELLTETAQLGYCDELKQQLVAYQKTI